MSDNIVKKIYLRCTLASIATCIVAGCAYAWLRLSIWQIIGFAALMFLYLGMQIIVLRNALKNGNCVVVYGACVAKEECYDVLGKKKRNVLSYRFVSAGQEEDPNTANNVSVASFYLQARKGQYVEGESYRFLFKKGQGQDNTPLYNENTLLGYEIFGAAPVSVIYSDTTSHGSDVDAQDDTVSAAEKLIMFQNREEREE